MPRPLLDLDQLDLDQLSHEVDARLAAADAALVAEFPGERRGRQPIHTVYVPADRMHTDLVPDWGEQATAALDAHHALFHDLVGDDDLVRRVRTKLGSEPIEDLRIDFEDGYGRRADDEEDAHVATAARALAESRERGSAAPFAGIRMKSLEAPTRGRGLRTLAGFVQDFAAAGGAFEQFVITLPKVTSVDQVAAMVFTCARLEAALDLDERSLRFEIQVETPQSILGPDGTALVARMVHAADRRCTALHYGTYDYSAFCGIAAEYQSMAHPVADHAKLVMQAAAAGTGVRLSDGSTNILPVGDAAAVEHAWRLHAQLVRRSLERGFYQGWDLHPAQLPTRYAATIAFYREGLERAGTRLRNYRERTDSAILDEPATARALADYVVRALDCAATTPDEVRAATGCGVDELTELARPTR